MSTENVSHFDQDIWHVDGVRTAAGGMLDPSQWGLWLARDEQFLEHQEHIICNICTVFQIPAQHGYQVDDNEGVATHSFSSTVEDTFPISFLYPAIRDSFWKLQYRAQGKRYPRPRRCRSKARMSKEWRDRA